MTFWLVIITVFLVNAALFRLAWPSIQERKVRRRLKRLDVPVMTWEAYQRHKVIVKVGEINPAGVAELVDGGGK